jgi:hypothetical protein
MRRLVGLMVVALTVSLGATVVCPAQVPSRLFLLFIDDLHIEFRMTPSVRALMIRRILPVLHRDRSALGLVTTGYSSVSIAPTTDSEVLLSGLRRITGGGLKVEQLLDERGADERRRRARIAIATAGDALERVASMAAERKVVLYVGDGYGGNVASVVEEIAALSEAARRASMPIHVLAVRNILNGPNPDPSPSNWAAWDAYRLEALSGLHTLALASGGQFASTPAELDDVMMQISREANE